jgi:hypothetical protein
MNAPQEPFYKRDASQTMADVRDARSRNEDFGPNREGYEDEVGACEVLAALEALTVEHEAQAIGAKEESTYQLAQLRADLDHVHE